MGLATQLAKYGFIIVLGVAIFRAAYLFPLEKVPQACQASKYHKPISLASKPQILDRFLGALNIPSVSFKPHQYDGPQMLNMVQFIDTNYPNLRTSPLVKRELIANYSLLYTIQGSNRKLRPYMLTSHLDVVPAISSRWSVDPFNATIKPDGYIYGRGTIDAKHLTMSILEAVEHLLANNFKPHRTILLAFGHDEEIMGYEGAQVIAKLVRERIHADGYDKLEYILDEGLVISKTRFPGVNYDVGLIGVAEKGYMAINVSTVGEVGHGSMPLSRTAISKLSLVLSRFHSNAMPSLIGQGVDRVMFDILARYADWPHKLVYANFWLFKPMIDYVFSQHPALNGLIRTTTAVTMIEGGTKENMLPDSASAVVNHRIHQAQSIEQVLEFDRQIINDPTVDVRVTFAQKASPVAPHSSDTLGYQLIRHSMLQVHDNVVVVPSIFLASTDSKWYLELTDCIYRFSAIAVELDELKSFHGHDERLSVANYEKLVNFFHHLVLNSDSDKLPQSQDDARDEL